MLSSDVIIVGSPTYVLEMTSHLKAFFEYIFTMFLPHRPEETMFSKIAVVVSAAAGAGMNGVVKSMARQMFYLGVSKTYRIPFRAMAASWDEVSDKKKERIALKTNRTALKITSQKERVRPGIKTKIMFLLMRLMQKKFSFASLDKAYWEEKNWLGKERPW